MNKLFFMLLSALPALFQPPKMTADLVIHHARVYTVDQAFSVTEAIAVKDGKILATGTSKDILARYTAKQVVDAHGKFCYPGFIDAHAHFMGYAEGLEQVNLVGTTSWNDILSRLRTASGNLEAGHWLRGRGWDQNDWATKEFPTREQLDHYFPDRPVFLKRVDGHAAIVNNVALNMAGLQPGMTINGGIVETKNGKLTGLLVDNAVGLVENHIPGTTAAAITTDIRAAQQNCFAVGLTTVDDCGIGYEAVQLIDSLQRAGIMKMKLYAMLSDNPKNYRFARQNGKISSGMLTVRAFKVYADGALGSRGACLLQAYSDKPGWVGFLLSAPAHFDSVAAVIHALGFQMCTHAIGDSGNRTILQTYGRVLHGKNDLRWRIEHAQVVAPADFPLFGQYSIIPSVQPTHATSDMYWATARLGKTRVKAAYAYRTLLKENGWLPLGTDFPVEDISPLKTFYAAVVRKDAKGFPAGGFQPENALSGQQALRGMTTWAAKANFEESEKGSLEKGKMADIVILDDDLMTTAPSRLLQIKVISTFVNGVKVYPAK